MRATTHPVRLRVSLVAYVLLGLAGLALIGTSIVGLGLAEQMAAGTLTFADAHDYNALSRTVLVATAALWAAGSYLSVSWYGIWLGPSSSARGRGRGVAVRQWMAGRPRSERLAWQFTNAAVLAAAAAFLASLLWSGETADSLRVGSLLIALGGALVTTTAAAYAFLAWRNRDLG